jgi:hypothetical protein
MREIEVIRETRAALIRQGIGGRRVVDMYTDAHPTLLADASLRPFQRFTLTLDGFSVHPDLVGRLDDGETTFAIEAKGRDELLTGLAQAASYRLGFHLVLLAAAAAIAPDVVTLARQIHVGVLAVTPSTVTILDLPPPHLPRLVHARAVQQQFATSRAVETTFTYNAPTHYLSVAAALRGQPAITFSALDSRLRTSYPVLPRDLRAVVRGAQKLGLVRVRGDTVELTLQGRAASELLPDLATLSSIHQSIASRGVRTTLQDQHPPSAAILRWLLAADPVAELIVETLTDLGGPVPLLELAQWALKRDRVRATTVFFTPEALAEITDAQGVVIWSHVQPRHFRSTTFFQYKSVLKHAGLIISHALGGASTVSYQPESDIWELRWPC